MVQFIYFLITPVFEKYNRDSLKITYGCGYLHKSSLTCFAESGLPVLVIHDHVCGGAVEPQLRHHIGGVHVEEDDVRPAG